MLVTNWFIFFLHHEKKTQQFASIDKVDKITTPALFISGLNDLLVPPSMMSSLHSLCLCRKQLFQLAGGGHMDTFLISGWVVWKLKNYY